MTQSFSPGDHPFSTLQSPGFYWINIDRKTDAELLGLHTVKALPPEAQAALMWCGDKPEQLLSVQDTLQIKQLPLFSLPEKKAAILHLINDLSRSITTRKRLYILLVNSTLWQNFTDEQLQGWVQESSAWLNKEQSTLLILSHGAGADSVRKRLITQYRFLSGLSQLKWLQNNARYIISWWSTREGLTANQTLTITYSDQGWVIDDPEFEPPISRNDEFLYFAEKNILEGITPLPPYWSVLESNELLVECGKDLQAATVIFALYAGNQIDKLARQINYLRKECGRALKIIVREMSNTIRFSDERLLMVCGANLIIPGAVSISKFLTLVESIQGQRFVRPVPDDVDTWLNALLPIQQKGYISSKEFTQVLLTRMSNTLLPENGKGILLVLHPRLQASQALSLCNLQRMGDVITLIDNQLFLFLSTCDINDRDTALRFIFRIPVDKLFIRYEVWDQDLAIITEIKKLNISNNEEPHREIIEDQQEKTEVEPVSQIKPTRRVPVDLTLK